MRAAEGRTGEVGPRDGGDGCGGRRRRGRRSTRSVVRGIAVGGGDRRESCAHLLCELADDERDVVGVEEGHHVAAHPPVLLLV